LQSIFKKIQINSIILDDENPRLAFAKIEKGIKRWTEESLSQEIKESISFGNLLNSIKENGVMDPIWVHDLGNKKYRVIEGNMRVTSLKELVKNKAKISTGVDYSVVNAHIVDKNTSKIDIEVQKAVLQTGKNPWGAFNEASHIYELFWRQKSSISDIANMLGKSTTYVSNEIDNFKFYKEFIGFAKQKKIPIDPNKYSFFKDASGNVRIKMFNSKSSRQQYFELIIPNKYGITRLPNVSLKNGLRVFAKFVEDEKILKVFLKNQKTTVDEAYFDFLEKNSMAKKPWLKKIPTITRGLQKLTNKEKQKLFTDREVNQHLKQLRIELNKFFK